MKKTTLLNILLTTLSFFTITCIEDLSAQIVIGAPNLQFSQACANESFNTFTTTFVFSPEDGISATNQFSIEMSDQNGDFSNPTSIFTSMPGEISTSPATIDFSLPSTTYGEEYKIRMKSTDPEAVSAPSQSFAAYYKIQDSPFSINELVSTAYFCPGGSYLLTIDNPGTGDNDSPLNYPSLRYNWYKELTPTTSVLIGQNPTLVIEEEGIYFVETNYGSCTSNSFSNRVTVLTSNNGEQVNATILSSLGNPFCIGEGATSLSTIAGNSYHWFLNGTSIPGATFQNYETTISGVYSVTVDFGSCQAIGSIDLQTGDFNSSIDVPSINELESGDFLDVSVTTTASVPEFEWLLNNEIIDNAMSNTYSANEFGNYRVRITQTNGCLYTEELIFQINEFIDPFPDVENIPNIISPNGDGINDTWIIPVAYTSGTNTEIMIISRQGKTVFQTQEYINNWPDSQLDSSDTNQIFYYIISPEGQESKKGSITIIK
jgi:gliding motility-associated-like protein